VSAGGILPLSLIICFQESLSMSEAKPVTILVVEDDAIVRMLIVDVLEELEYQVLEAADKAEALVVLKDTTQPLGLMMTDVGLPDGDGVQLASQALAMRVGLPVLIASGYADTVKNPPGTEVLGKPFSIDQLRDKVRAMLGN
jgi:DNA-binding response OmpR family regulator